MSGPSPQRAQEIVDSLRRGTVPAVGLDTFAVGLDAFEGTVDAELDTAARRGAVFKAVRGEYGSGKTFFVRWLQERAKRRGFAVAEVQISETETPLHRLETVYRRMIERLGTADTTTGALRSVVDGWFYILEEDVLAGGSVDAADGDALVAAATELMEERLASVSRTAPMFAAALRGYRAATVAGDAATAGGILAWLGGEPHVAASVKRSAGIKGDVDHFMALGFLQGLLEVLHDAGHPGLVVVLDEVETLQRVRGDVREKSLNALRQLVDEIDAGRFPGLYLVITGTPAFFDGPQGVQRLAPLAQRLHVDFGPESRYDNPRAPQIRLPGFDRERLCEVGAKVRDIYAGACSAPDRVRAAVDDPYVAVLADAVTGDLGGKVGIAPRLYLKKLVDVCDRVDQFGDFDPRRDYPLTVSDAELTPTERNARAAQSPDDVELDM